MIGPEDEELAGPGGEDPGDWDPFAEYGDDYEIQLTPDDPSPRPVPQAGSSPPPIQGFMSKKYINHIKTNKSLIVMFDKGSPITVLRESPQYKTVSDLIDRGQFHEIAATMDKAYGIYSRSNGKFLVEDNRVKIDGEVLPQALSTRLIQFIDNGIPTGPLEAFWDNLRHNASESSKQDLYAFLEANHIPLTEDGCFIGYKRVGGDYKDLRTRKMDNSPGKVVSMPRDQVDPNRHNTCSTGLHVAAFGYASSQYGSGGQSTIRSGSERLLKVKVNPKDVVAVPPDYNAQKMRVCRYEVLGDLNQTKELDTLIEPTPPVEEEAIEEAVEEITEEIEQKLEQKRVTKVRFKPVVVAADAEGRLRIPGHAIRQLDVGVGRKVVAIVENARSRNVKLVKATKNLAIDKGAKASRVYVAQGDNSVRLPPSFLAEAKIAGKSEYTVRLTQGTLEIRPV